MNISILGQNIKRIREEQNMSAYKLRKKANVGAATISGIEDGSRQSLNSDTVDKIAKALGVTTDSLYSTQLDTEYIVNDIYDSIDMILESDEVTIEGTEMTEKEKQQFKVGVNAILEIIKMNRQIKNNNEGDNK